MGRNVAAVNNPSVRGIDAQTWLMYHSGGCAGSRTIHRLDVTVGVHVHLPLIKLVTCGGSVGAHAELHHQQRKPVGVRYVEGLHIVRARHTVAVAPEEVNLWVVVVAVG